MEILKIPIVLGGLFFLVKHGRRVSVCEHRLLTPKNIHEPVHEKTNNLHRQKQSRRSASR